MVPCLIAFVCGYFVWVWMWRYHVSTWYLDLRAPEDAHVLHTAQFRYSGYCTFVFFPPKNMDLKCTLLVPVPEVAKGKDHLGDHTYLPFATTYIHTTRATTGSSCSTESTGCNTGCTGLHWA
ncbi:hypothetical protein F4805DRAFT_314255 [Annulohypoxylon moriforme]|nr:hypothetical protein F4805DRAFT_314255 [Annulohypoxylon moriforme]